MRIVHVITGLEVGGAEMMLLRLCAELKSHSRQHVVSLTGLGAVAERLQSMGISVEALGLSSPVKLPVVFYRLVRILKQGKPEIVQAWLYHADLIGGLAARLAGIRNVVWNVRNHDLSPDRTKLHTRIVVGLCARFSHWLPKKIITCSNAARDSHIATGYDASRILVIPNGFDLEKFVPSNEARVKIRKEMSLSEDTRLIGLIARYDPQKNHAGLLVAAAFINNTFPDVHFLLVGRGVDKGNNDLMCMVREKGLERVVHLLGERKDIPELTAALDIASLSSWGEAFPNVLGEAMACGVPCVATNAGDAALIIGQYGYIVPCGDMQGLAAKWEAILSLSDEERRTLGGNARRHIERHFDLNVIVHRYMELYRELTMKTGMCN